MYRLRPRVPLLVVKGQDGKLHHHWNQPIGGSIGHGAVIPWLSPEQREHFLRKGLVERIEDGTPMSDTADEPAGSEDRVRECVEALDRLGLPLDTGAPTARANLRDSDYRFGNDTIAAAVKARKDSHPPLSRTAGD